MARMSTAKANQSNSSRNISMGNAAAKKTAISSMSAKGTKNARTVTDTQKGNKSAPKAAQGPRTAKSKAAANDGGRNATKRKNDLDTRLDDFDDLAQQEDNLVDSPDPKRRNQGLAPHPSEEQRGSHDYVDEHGENIPDDESSSTEDESSENEPVSAAEQTTNKRKRNLSHQNDENRKKQHRERTIEQGANHSANVAEHDDTHSEKDEEELKPKRKVKDVNETGELNSYDRAFRELQTCPGGHLTAKSSGGKSTDVSASDRETSKRIRVALNVLHFKNALHEIRDNEHLIRVIAQVYNTYKFCRAKDMKKGLELNASTYRWFFRTKRRNVLASYIQNNLHAQVSEALLRYFDFPRSYTEAQKETVIRDMRDYGLDRMNHEDRQKLYATNYESVFQGISTDGDRFEEFTNLDTVVSHAGFRRHLFKACPPPPYANISMHWKSTTNLLRYIHAKVTRSKDNDNFMHPVKLPYFLLEHIMTRPEEKGLEPYFVVSRSIDLMSETKNWHDQHLKGKPKVSFDFQIPVELETYAAIMLHGAFSSAALKTLGYLQKRDDVGHGKSGAIRPDHSKINPYLAVGNKKAADVYKVMVLSDRQSTIGVKDKEKSNVTSGENNGDDDLDDDDQPSLDVQNMNRRWITCLRLYCAIDGSLPLLATGPWAGIVTHYRRKLNSTRPEELLTADDSDNEALGTSKTSNSNGGNTADDLAAEEEANVAETERMLNSITDDRKRRRLSSIMIASREDDEGF